MNINEATITIKFTENELITLMDALRCTREMRPETESNYYTNLITDFKKMLMNAEEIRQEQKPQERNNADTCPECHDLGTISSNNE